MAALYSTTALEELRNDLPTGLAFVKNGVWQASKRYRGRRYHKTLGRHPNVSKEEAILKFNVFLDNVVNFQDPHRGDYDISILQESEPVNISGFDDRYLNRAIIKAQQRSKTRNQECSITIEDLRRMIRESGGCCTVTGIKFSFDNPTNSRVRPFLASIDRIDTNRGYTADNCRLVCAAVNLALMDFGESVFAKLANHYVAKKLAEN